MKDYSRKREHKRVPADVTVKIKTPEGDYGPPCTIRNISLGGVFIVMSDPLPYGTDVDLEFQLPVDPSVVRCRGMVVWTCPTVGPTSNNQSGAGVQLVDISVKDLRILNKYIEQNLQS